MPRHRKLNYINFVNSVDFRLTKKCVDQIVPAELQPTKIITDGEYVDFLLDHLKKKGREDLVNEILELFTKINDLGHKTMNVLVQATNLFGIQRSGKERKSNLAMRLYLDHQDAFQYAYDRYCFYASSSTVREYPVEGYQVKFTKTNVETFQKLVGKFYGKLEKGYDVEVRSYKDSPESLLVIDRGSYYQTKAVWEKGKLKTITYRPAAEDILVYNKDTSILSIKAPYDKDRTNYRAAFYQAIIGNVEPEPDPEALYTLKSIQEGTFDYEGDESVAGVTLLSVKLRFSKKASIVLTSGDLNKSLEKEFSDYSLESGEMIHAKFRFQVILDDKDIDVIVEITPPNITDLYKKAYAPIIANYLRKQGVKLK